MFGFQTENSHLPSTSRCGPLFNTGHRGFSTTVAFMSSFTAGAGVFGSAILTAFFTAGFVVLGAAFFTAFFATGFFPLGAAFLTAFFTTRFVLLGAAFFTAFFATGIFPFGAAFFTFFFATDILLFTVAFFTLFFAVRFFLLVDAFAIACFPPFSSLMLHYFLIFAPSSIVFFIFGSLNILPSASESTAFICFSNNSSENETSCRELLFSTVDR